MDLKENLITFPNETVKKLISEYAREAGKGNFLMGRGQNFRQIYEKDLRKTYDEIFS